MAIRRKALMQPEMREALAEGVASADLTFPGETRQAHGRIAMVKNTVDPATGMVTVRAAMPNDDKPLWPGTLVNVQTTVRTEDAVIVPSNNVQVRQQGPFVFVVRDNIPSRRSRWRGCAAPKPSSNPV